jgi:hypothetical protein
MHDFLSPPIYVTERSRGHSGGQQDEMARRSPELPILLGAKARFAVLSQ